MRYISKNDVDTLNYGINNLLQTHSSSIHYIILNISTVRASPLVPLYLQASSLAITEIG
ncbi:hypothetical protein FHS57_001089 [Runella defluvii]|uniref:Uncharacterized protein n=1 Tax=Runella defluvii TaxID=370973 RepID=A0A7W5ZH74_9BACT|nr:hypothetical protein [Runella defluvii]